MAWTGLKAAIAAIVKTNGNEEIEGQNLQDTLSSIVDNVGENATFKGIASLDTVPGTPDGPVFYMATDVGPYANFGLTILTSGVYTLKYDGTTWTKERLKDTVNERDVSVNTADYFTKSSTFTVSESIDVPITSLRMSNFLKDIKLQGTPEAGYTYYLMVNYFGAPGNPYNFNLGMYKVDAGLTKTLIFSHDVGDATPNESEVITYDLNTFGTSQGTVTGAKVAVLWGALKGVTPKQYSSLGTAEGWLYDNDYLFDNTSEFGYIKESEKANAQVGKIEAEVSRTRGLMFLKDSTFELTVTEDPLTPLIMSNFLKDIKLQGTPEAGYTYHLALNYNSAPGNSYNYWLAIYKADAGFNKTLIFATNVGDAAPESGEILAYSLGTYGSEQGTVTGAKVAVLWGALKDVSNISYGELGAENGWLYDNDYLFDNDSSYGYFASSGVSSEVSRTRGLFFLPGSTFTPKSVESPITSLILSNFLKDIKLQGSAEAGYTYHLIIQYYAAAGHPYNFYLGIYKVDAAFDKTLIYGLNVGSDLPDEGEVLTYELAAFGAEQGTVTGVKVATLWGALKGVTPGVYGDMGAEDGWLYDNDYLFDNTSEFGYFKEAEILGGVLSLKPRLSIPSKVYAPVGVELNLWHDALVLGTDRGLSSPLEYDVVFDSPVGVMTERSLRYTPILADVGVHSATIKVYGVGHNLIESKGFQIEVINTAPSVSKNIVMASDSLNSGGQVTTPTRDNFVAIGGVVPVFVGTRGTAPNNHESVGGYRYEDFATAGRQAFRCQVTGVTSIGLGAKYTNNGHTWDVVEVNITAGTGNILVTKFDIVGSPDTIVIPSGTLVKISGSGDATVNYTGAVSEGANPFWNDTTEEVDFDLYATDRGISQVDILSMQCGINDSGLGADDAGKLILKGYIDTIYNALIAHNANAILVLQLPSTSGNTKGGAGANYGADFETSEYASNIFGVRELLIDTYDAAPSYPNAMVGVAGLVADRYYGYNLSDAPISARVATTEKVHTNYVHPTSSGSNQMGDGTFSILLEAAQ